MNMKFLLNIGIFQPVILVFRAFQRPFFFRVPKETLPNNTSKRSKRVAKLRQYDDGPPDLSAVQLARSVWGSSGFFFGKMVEWESPLPAQIYDVYIYYVYICIYIYVSSI